MYLEMYVDILLLTLVVPHLFSQLGVLRGGLAKSTKLPLSRAQYVGFFAPA